MEYSIGDLARLCQEPMIVRNVHFLLRWAWHSTWCFRVSTTPLRFCTFSSWFANFDMARCSFARIDLICLFFEGRASSSPSKSPVAGGLAWGGTVADGKMALPRKISTAAPGRWIFAFPLFYFADVIAPPLLPGWPLTLWGWGIYIFGLMNFDQCHSLCGMLICLVDIWNKL